MKVVLFYLTLPLIVALCFLILLFHDAKNGIEVRDAKSMNVREIICVTETENLSDYTPELKIFYINADEARERNSAMEKKLQEIGIAYERYSAISPNKTSGLFSEAKSVCSGRSDNEIGCTLSHLSLLQKIASDVNASMYPIVIVLEDDAVLSTMRLWPALHLKLFENRSSAHSACSGTQSSADLLSMIGDFLSAEWNIVNLSPGLTSWPTLHSTGDLLVPWIQPHWGTVAYALNMTGSWVSSMKPLAEIDKCRVADEIVYESVGKAWSTMLPLCLYGNEHESQIHADHEASHTAFRKAGELAWTVALDGLNVNECWNWTHFFERLSP